MAQITRFDGNVEPFAHEALGTERTVFGAETQSDALDDNINSDFFRGWGIVGVNQLPTKQDFNAFAYTSTALTSYLFQMGVPEWNTSQEYFANGIANRNGVLFRAVIDNSGNDPAIDDGTNWLPLVEVANPTGTVITVAQNAVPDGYLECDGSAISRTVYADLFSKISTDYGSGDGSTTFNLPDLRGEFVRGFDNGRGVDSGRVFGSSQLDAFQQWTAGFYTRWNYTQGGTSGAASQVDSGQAGAANASDGAEVTIDPSTVARTASETRPRNVAMLYCIKY